MTSSPSPPRKLLGLLCLLALPLCWLLSLAITHELSSSIGPLRPALTSLTALLHGSEGASNPALVSLIGLTLGALFFGGLLFKAHELAPRLRERYVSSPFNTSHTRKPSLIVSVACLLLVIGGAILGSEVSNLMSQPSAWEATLEAQSATSELTQAWRAALWTPWGWAYELVLLPIIEVWVAQLVVQRALPVRSPTARVLITTLVATLFSWRLSLSPVIVNLAAALVFEHTRSLLLMWTIYLDYQILCFAVALGYTFGVSGFDDSLTPFQPLWFDVCGALCFLFGYYVLQKTPTFEQVLVEGELLKVRLEQPKRDEHER
jgi:hypothetical protein